MADAQAQARVAVVGVGNELMSDDGVGVHLVRCLRDEGHDERIELIEAGTALVAALDLVPPGCHVLVVDAATGGCEPGSIYRLGLDDVGSGRGISLHESSLPEAFAVAELGGGAFHRVVILGIEPGRVDVGTELSPAVARKLPALLDAVRQEIATLLGPGD